MKSLGARHALASYRASVLHLFRHGSTIGTTSPSTFSVRRQLISSTLSKRKKLYDLEIYVSQSPSPYFNLSFEDYLFKQFPVYRSESTSSTELAKKVLLLYTNHRSVIIGRNQNPWRETNVQSLRANNIPIIRRKSGGGTVFHDEGNANYSVMMPSNAFDRDEHALLLCRALNPVLSQRREQTVLSVNERHDIVDQDARKVSGSAYKLQRGKAYHHGTMLLNSELEVLSKLLHHSPDGGLEEVDGPGVQSVRSPVSNIGISNAKFTDVVIHAFEEAYTSVSNNTLKIRYVDEGSITKEEAPEINKRIEELQSWEWTFGSTPKFVHRFSMADSTPAVSFTVEGGIITDLESDLPEFAENKDTIVGIPYRGAEVASRIGCKLWKQRLLRSI
ncbi:hypothetical protein POJ06DRAFT_199256 [Lipomyces tetrasporus]|uniref:Putative lipoate-protein ligase A n=1 Tax=Lipomyces tetrasporus TaxID=54092 RepID=A0AAD7VRW0_9ASCO|nr:uncharacterized protein POJ06DRAFT_199256 [Lipomyces tetrasporus]KAJ8099326.1 hypothetical protein POJ06DRAFT_199256 [Lipomyces tetrasporus]